MNMSKLVCFNADGGVFTRAFLEDLADGVLGAPDVAVEDEDGKIGKRSRDDDVRMGVEVDCCCVDDCDDLRAKVEIIYLFPK